MELQWRFVAEVRRPAVKPDDRRDDREISMEEVKRKRDNHEDIEMILSRSLMLREDGCIDYCVVYSALSIYRQWEIQALYIVHR